MSVSVLDLEGPSVFQFSNRREGSMKNKGSLIFSSVRHVAIPGGTYSFCADPFHVDGLIPTAKEES